MNQTDYYLQEKKLTLPSGLKIKVKEVSLLHLLEICSELNIDIDEIASNPKIWQSSSFLPKLLQVFILDDIDVFSLRTQDIIFLINEVSKSFQDTFTETK